MYECVNSTNRFGMLKSGNPCERLTAPCSRAKPLITVKMVVPTFGSLECIDPGNFINGEDRISRLSDTPNTYPSHQNISMQKGL